MPESLYAVVLAGGIGSRFWPLSTPDRPKQL
ncbi:MAG: Nucleotidyl transferase, partial [Gemmatimonadota bacterium]